MTKERIMIILALLAAATFHSPATAQEWSAPVRISEPTGGYYPYILACGDTLHVAYQSSSPMKIEYNRSIDGGRTWGNRQVLSDTINTTDTWNPRIMYHNGELLAVWRAYFLHGVYRNDIAYSHSSDGGATWTAPQYVLDPNFPMPFWLTASSSGSTINLMLSMAEDDSMGFYNIRNTDFGQTWSEPQRIFRSQGGGVMDMASAGDFVHLVWSGRSASGPRYEIYYVRSVDGGISWAANSPLSTPDQYHSQRPAIGVDPAGKTAVTWMDYKYTTQPTTGDIFLRQSSDSGETWDFEEQITFDHFSHISDVVTNGDTIQIAWENESQGSNRGSIYYKRSTDSGETWDDPLWLDRTADASWNPALACSAGRVYAIWYDDREPPESIGLYFSCWPDEPDAIEEGRESALPGEIPLSAYPNPFNSSVVISYSGSNGGDIKKYNALGQIIRRFDVDASGEGRVAWDGTDQTGHQVSCGVYLIELRRGNLSRAIKVVFAK